MELDQITRVIVGRSLEDNALFFVAGKQSMLESTALQQSLHKHSVNRDWLNYLSVPDSYSWSDFYTIIHLGGAVS